MRVSKNAHTLVCNLKLRDRVTKVHKERARAKRGKCAGKGLSNATLQRWKIWDISHLKLEEMTI